jgi:hypothetical protein
MPKFDPGTSRSQVTLLYHTDDYQLTKKNKTHIDASDGIRISGSSDHPLLPASSVIQQRNGSQNVKELKQTV